jgi:hypothetical protein
VLSVLLAERAVLGYNESVGVVALVLVAVIVSVLTFGALKCYFSPC